MLVLKKNRKLILQLTLFILAVIFIRLWQQQDLIAGEAPHFTSYNLKGQTYALGDGENEVKLVHFWATWCSICALENDNIQNIAKDYKVFNIAMQSGSDKEIMRYAKKHKLDNASIINDRFGTLAKHYGVKATPTSFIIDKRGNIAFTEVGYTTELGLRLRLWWASL